MTESQPPPVSGLVAGKYEVLHLIGRGGMGSVWEGRHVTLGTRVAIKFIDSDVADSKEARSRFLTEARAAATLASKHAIQIFDHGMTDDGRPYMVMELLTGEPLDKRIDRQGRLPLQDTARILAQVSRALSRAHAAGIIHRDLKPENIFLVRTPDEDDEVAKVLDFGIAKIKATPGEMGLSSSTKTGAVLGTPYYMAPEQARGLRTIDTRADLWSLGVIAYKCVTGVLPFDGESVGDLLVKICTAPPPVPSLTVPGLPREFDAWFARALEREPDQRFQSASELSDALALAAGLSLRRGPASSLPGGGVPPQSASSSRHGAEPTLPAAALTSSPFVTSPTLPMKSSRGVLLTGIAVALVVGTGGVLLSTGVVGSRAPAPGASGALVAPPAPAPPSASAPASVTLGPLPAPSASAPAGAPASTPAPPPATATAHGKPAPPRPAPAPTHAAAPRPAPPSSDPGY